MQDESAGPSVSDQSFPQKTFKPSQAAGTHPSAGVSTVFAASKDAKWSAGQGGSNLEASCAVSGSESARVCSALCRWLPEHTPKSSSTQRPLADSGE